MTDAVPTELAAPVPAALDRRFHAFVLDRVLAWSLTGLVGWLILDLAGSRPALLLSALVLAVLTVLGVVWLGRTGSSVGRLVLGLRVVAADGGGPIGVPAALRRQLLLAVATLPTFGLGAVVLALTAVADPRGTRRGRHDLVAGSIVVDVRRPPGPAPATGPETPSGTEAEHEGVVNLTPVDWCPRPPVRSHPCPDRPCPTGAYPDPQPGPPTGSPPGPRPGGSGSTPARACRSRACCWSAVAPRRGPTSRCDSW